MQRRGGQKELFSTIDSSLQSLANLVALSICVAQLVRFIDYNEIPFNLAELILQFCCIVIRQYHNLLLIQRESKSICLQLSVRLCVDH